MRITILTILGRADQCLLELQLLLLSCPFLFLRYGRKSVFYLCKK